MTKKETFKFIIQIIASVATAIVTALGATSCMGHRICSNSNRNSAWRNELHGRIETLFRD